MTYTAVVERDKATGLLVGSIPGLPGAHTSGETVEEIRANLQEVLGLLMEQGALAPVSDIIGNIQVTEF